MSSASARVLEPLHRWQEDVENLEAYRSGGYHPVLLGDTYRQDRYCVVHKLGYGSFSTVWLAKDRLTNTYVSLKILKANFSRISNETQIPHHLEQHSQKHPGRGFVTFLLDEFTISGPNGDHRCLVSEALGPNVHDLKESFTCELLPLKIARRVVVQLALGLAYVHLCDVVHGGQQKSPCRFSMCRSLPSLDVHIKNIACKPPNIHSWSTAQVYEHLGPPAKEIVMRNDGKPLGPEIPPYVVPPAIPLDSSGSTECNISLLDFGEASFASALRHKWHAPLLLQAPEALLGESVGQPADVWAFACTVFELFSNSPLFRGFMPSRDDVLSEIVDTMGPLPEQWWKKWGLRGEYYEEDGRKKTEDLTEEYQEVKPLATRIRRMRSSPPAARQGEQLSEEDVAGLQQLLRQCLKYKPEDRSTMEDILDSDWIAKLRSNISET